MIHLYAFADSIRSLPAQAGVAGEALEQHVVDGVCLVAGTVPAPPHDSKAAALAHGLVVQSLLEHADSVLPARLVTPFADVDALIAATRPRLSDLRSALTRVRGCVELSVRLAEPKERPRDAGSYLRQLQGTIAQRTALVESLEPWTADRRGDAYLVRRDDVPAFARAVDRYAAAHTGVSLLCTGPWAPYSFTERAA